jgi:hypothetical protein
MFTRVKLSLRFQMRMEELLHPDQNSFALAACLAVGSIDRMLHVGALVADPVAVEWLRSMLPKKYGGRLTGAAAQQARDAIRKWGFAVGGAEWKRDLGARVARGPIDTYSND